MTYFTSYSRRLAVRALGADQIIGPSAARNGSVTPLVREGSVVKIREDVRLGGEKHRPLMVRAGPLLVLGVVAGGARRASDIGGRATPRSGAGSPRLDPPPGEGATATTTARAARPNPRERAAADRGWLPVPRRGGLPPVALPSRHRTRPARLDGEAEDQVEAAVVEPSQRRRRADVAANRARRQRGGNPRLVVAEGVPGPDRELGLPHQRRSYQRSRDRCPSWRPPCPLSLRRPSNSPWRRRRSP